MKKIISMLLVITLFSISVIPAAATVSENKSVKVVSIEPLEDGYYVETTIEILPQLGFGNEIQATYSTITSTKTSSYKNSNGDVMCSLSITGTFTYNGSTSSCTSCYHSYSAPGSTWEVLNASSSRSGNSATATATARHHLIVSYADYPMSVTVSCSANGTIS